MKSFKSGTTGGILLLLGMLAGADTSERAQLGGYAKNVSTLWAGHDETISDVGLVQLEGLFSHGEHGSIEATVIVSSTLAPLDPFETVRKGSVTDRALKELVAPFVESVSGYLGTADSLMHPPEKADTPFMAASDIERLLRHVSYSSYYPDDKIMLDRALVKVYFGPFDLFAGRQTIAWGTGYAFNPTDVWNAKNPLDPDEQKRGVNAVRIEAPLGDQSGIAGVVSFGRDIGHTSGGMRFKTTLGRFDLSVCGMKIMNSDRELFGLPKKIMAGADMAGEVAEIGVWAEGAINNPVYKNMNYTDFDSAFFQADCGVDHTFENSLYTMIEYYYNGLGSSRRNHYGSRDLINLLTGESSGFGRHYLFGGMTYTLDNRFNLSFFSLGNLTDFSGMLLPTIGYNPVDDITLEAGLQIGVGDKKRDEYGGTYPAVLLTATGYF